MMKIWKQVLCAGTFSLCLSMQAQAALIGGADTVYDQDRNITWLANANLAATEGFGVSGIDYDGGMNWDTAQAWIAGMNAYDNDNGWLGFNNWRLPTALNADGSGPCDGNNCTGSEMGHLFYEELSGTAEYSVLTSGDPDLALFSNIQGSPYWSGTELESDSSRAWRFRFGSGYQMDRNKSFTYMAWAVHDGDINPIPVPAAVWLFGSGMLGLLGLARRKR